ncbi:MAG TPA: M17 family peptidase N-terminal domain-containing protein, partial [Gaiellaceae bacterium]
MDAVIQIAPAGDARADTLAVLVPEPPDGFGAGDAALRSRIAQVAADGELRGERREAVVLRVDGQRVVAAGIGVRDHVDLDALRTAAGAAAKALARVGGSICWLLDESLPL